MLRSNGSKRRLARTSNKAFRLRTRPGRRTKARRSANSPLVRVIVCPEVAHKGVRVEINDQPRKADDGPRLVVRFQPAIFGSVAQLRFPQSRLSILDPEGPRLQHSYLRNISRLLRWLRRFAIRPRAARGPLLGHGRSQMTQSRFDCAIALALGATILPSLALSETAPPIGGGYKDAISIPVDDPATTAIAGALFKPARDGALSSRGLHERMLRARAQQSP